LVVGLVVVGPATFAAKVGPVSLARKLQAVTNIGTFFALHVGLVASCPATKVVSR